MSSTADLERFYEILNRLDRTALQGQLLGSYTGRSGLPNRGVYFFREPGQHRSGDARAPRIVRVGTHAVSRNSKSKLWGRLRAHRGDRSGGGNHRGSVFRLHVGAALLERDSHLIAAVPTWASGQSAPRSVRDGEREHEARVSAHICSMSIVWTDISDEPGPESLRSYIERNSIALLSNQLKPHDPPSPAWLGLHSPREAIRLSGLWNLNYVDDAYDPAFLDELERLVM